MNHCDITIIGARIIGLAIASELSQERGVVVIEKIAVMDRKQAQEIAKYVKNIVNEFFES